jgi:hypothetical protein
VDRRPDLKIILSNTHLTEPLLTCIITKIVVVFEWKKQKWQNAANWCHFRITIFGGCLPILGVKLAFFFKPKWWFNFCWIKHFLYLKTSNFRQFFQRIYFQNHQFGSLHCTYYVVKLYLKIKYNVTSSYSWEFVCLAQ